jgi:hypothetical protein
MAMGESMFQDTVTRPSTAASDVSRARTAQRVFLADFIRFPHAFAPHAFAPQFRS